MKRFEASVVFAVIAGISLIQTGCGMGFMFSGLVPGSSDAGEPTGLAAQVAGRALTIGEQIGGEDGFGGAVVDGYLSHMEDHMGFHGMDNLADPDGHMTVVLHNESNRMRIPHLTLST